MKMPSAFRPKITVFGETYKCIDVREDVSGSPLILYRVTSSRSKSKKSPTKVATLEDWMEWDRNSIEG